MLKIHFWKPLLLEDEVAWHFSGLGKVASILHALGNSETSTIFISQVRGLGDHLG